MTTNEDRQPTLGDQFKDARAIKHLSLEDVEEATKVRLRHLTAIEEGRYHELPSDVFAVGFIRRYAKLLGLDPEVAATIFRRERAAARTGRKKSPSFGPAKSTQEPRFILSSRAIIALFAGLVVLLLFGYIWYQVRLFAAPPQISLASPTEDTVSQVETVTVAGSTSPTATLFINSEPVPLDEQGGFRQDVKLTAGVNTIEIKAVNRLGKEATKVVNVLFEEPAPQGIENIEGSEETQRIEGNEEQSP